MSERVVIKSVTKRYGDFKAVNDISLEIKEGEFFTLLGPSGCGKTTLLRMIAGFNSIDEGSIFFGDKMINQVPAHTRDIGMVFQNYAIFPHMTIFDNVAYGLKARKISKEKIKQRVMDTLEIVQIDHLWDRMPANMSGGQQQRVALARAIVIEPKILLMDEPLSNLDAKLRVQMRTIIKKLQRRLNITTVYVTHDQEEALAISDRIAIMKNGTIMQIDAPEIIYKNPNNDFVANFIGTSNFMEGKIHNIIEKNLHLEVNNYLIEVDLAAKNFVADLTYRTIFSANNLSIGDTVKLSIRPEAFLIVDLNQTGMDGEIEIATFLASYWYYEVRLISGEMVEVHEHTRDIQNARNIGDKIRLAFDLFQISIFTENGEESIQ